MMNWKHKPRTFIYRPGSASECMKYAWMKHKQNIYLYIYLKYRYREIQGENE